MENKEHYLENEFNLWAYRQKLTNEEDFLTTHFLVKDKKTLEGGTGGGRILLELKAKGFTNLSGFDFLPDFISIAKKRDKGNEIDFRVLNATKLDYKNEYFDQLIYLQQILCLIDKESRKLAMNECSRVLKHNGTALFSFLCYDTRVKQFPYYFFIFYLKLFRAIFSKKRDIQLLPWLKVSNKINFKALLDKAPYVYWYRMDEAAKELESAGFRITHAGTMKQIADLKMLTGINELKKEKMEGMLYFVCINK